MLFRSQKELSLMSMHGVVAKFLNTYNFIIVPDHSREKLYLNVYDSNLSALSIDNLNNIIAQQFGEEFCFADVFNFPAEELKFGMKINGPLLLYLFRERNK